MKEMVLAALAESARLKSDASHSAVQVVEAAQMIANTFSNGGRLYLFGNGGSAADAQHIAAEFVNRLLIERPPLPAVALTTDSSVLTSIANDYSYNEVFVKQIKAFGRQGDVAWGISTSGNSPNVIHALRAAKNMGMKTITMTGSGGGEARGMADILLEVDSKSCVRIQEVHITFGHIICELVDYILFQKPGEAAKE